MDTIIVKANYSEGRMHGIVRTHFTDIQELLMTPYVHGVKHGTEQRFKNDNLIQETEYVNGVITGFVESRHSTGEFLSRVFFQDGKQEGLETTYHENGFKMSEVKFENGLKQGVQRTWYCNGSVSSEVKYLDGLKEGLFQSFHSNGKGKSLVSYSKNKREGRMLCSSFEGVLELEEFYEDGVHTRGKRFSTSSSSKEDARLVPRGIKNSNLPRALRQ